MKLSALALSGAVALSAMPASAGHISARKENQQDRIAQGVASGQLTPRETARLERQEAGLNREERGMREENGGTLTRGDRRLLNHQQNRLSREIYRQKHDAQTQHP
jgi:hypothetical protein